MHARLELGDVVAELADPQLRPGKVAEHGDLAADPLGRGPDRPDRGRMALAVPMREVEAEDIHSRLISCSSTGASQLAGPTVAMILVRLPSTPVAAMLAPSMVMTVVSDESVRRLRASRSHWSR